MWYVRQEQDITTWNGPLHKPPSLGRTTIFQSKSLLQNNRMIIFHMFFVHHNLRTPAVISDKMLLYIYKKIVLLIMLYILSNKKFQVAQSV